MRELAEAIAASSAIVVATAGPVDDRAGLTHPPHEGGATKVTLRIEEVVHGAATPGERELWFHGGVNANGTITGSSADPPSLLEGDRYILFLRHAPPGRSPLVRSRYALLRIVRFGDQERVVDEYGRGLVVDAHAGLRPLGKISEAMLERSIAKAREHGSGLEYVSQDRLVPTDIERASPLPAVLALIADVASRAAPGHGPHAVQSP
jgi:hypothetical protein